MKTSITYIPHFVCLVGSRVKGNATEDSDWDIVIRKEDRDKSLELLIKRFLGEDKNYHFIYNPYGPHDEYMPIFDLKLIPKVEIEKGNEIILKGEKNEFDLSEEYEGDNIWDLKKRNWEKKTSF